MWCFSHKFSLRKAVFSILPLLLHFGLRVLVFAHKNKVYRFPRSRNAQKYIYQSEIILKPFFGPFHDFSFLDRGQVGNRTKVHSVQPIKKQSIEPFGWNGAEQKAWNDLVFQLASVFSTCFSDPFNVSRWKRPLLWLRQFFEKKDRPRVSRNRQRVSFRPPFWRLYLPKNNFASFLLPDKV